MKREAPVSEQIHIRIHPDLRRLVEQDADSQFVNMNEVIAGILAEHYQRPELARIPRKPLGRPRKELPKPNGKRQPAQV